MLDRLLVVTIKAAVPIGDGDFYPIAEALDRLREIGFAEMVDISVVTGTVETCEPAAEGDASPNGE